MSRFTFVVRSNQGVELSAGSVDAHTVEEAIEQVQSFGFVDEILAVTFAQHTEVGSSSFYQLQRVERVTKEVPIVETVTSFEATGRPVIL